MRLCEYTQPDGRLVQYFEHGTGDLLVVYHHGTSVAGPIPAALCHSADRHGVRLVEFVRPGYGASTRMIGRSVADIASISARLAQHVGASRFACLGWSGGGPHALATAALLPDECVAVMCLSGVAPFAAEGIDFLDGMGEANVTEFHLALQGEAALRPWLEEGAQIYRDLSLQDVVNDFDSLLSDVDRAAMSEEIGAEFAACLRWSAEAGIDGWIDDDLALVSPWGFDIAAITQPAIVWHGIQDRMVPRTHAEWLAEHIPGARVELLPEHGHISILREAFDEGLAFLRAGWE
jgi:pimeloyl-ACP methyl ester carboxylesterase